MSVENTDLVVFDTRLDYLQNVVTGSLSKAVVSGSGGSSNTVVTPFSFPPPFFGFWEQGNGRLYQAHSNSRQPGAGSFYTTLFDDCSVDILCSASGRSLLMTPVDDSATPRTTTFIMYYYISGQRINQ